MTALTTSRGSKRSRREEEDTPPRPTLDDLEREDQAEQHMAPGRALLNHPQEAELPAGTALGQSQAADQQGRAEPSPAGQTRRASGAQPPVGQHHQLVTSGKSAKKHQGQSSITNFLTGALQPANTDVQHQQQQASHISSSPGETCFSLLAAAASVALSHVCIMCD